MADRANGILRNAAIAVPLKYLSNFWRSLEMPLINCKVEFKLKWSNYCVLSAAGADNVSDNVNDNVNCNNIIFTIKDTKLYVPVVTLSSRDKQKLSKLLSLLECYESNFLESNFVRVNRLFVLTYLNRDNDVKRFKTQRHYLPKGIVKNYDVIINGKDFYDQPIDSDIK